MRRARLLLLTVSLAVVLGFSGLLLANRQSQDELYRALGNLAEVVHLVHTEYVDELDHEALAQSLEAGIVESVDPWAAVLPDDKVDRYCKLLESPPAYGLTLIVRFSSAAVRHTIPNSPAASAGLIMWEVIEEVDGVNTKGRPLWQIRLELAEHEEAGKTVKLTVVDRLVDERREVVLEPIDWQPQALTITKHESATQIVVNGLPLGAAAALEKAVAGPKPLILDLRDLVWGFEEEAIKAADLFADSGLLGVWRGKRAGESRFEATAGKPAGALPVVLVGPTTEGVGEVLAAAMQGLGATVVGHRSARHAPHMRMIHDRDIHLWLPVAHWLRADSTPIDGNGIEPDEKIEAPPVDRDSDTEDQADPVLDRALELIR